MIGRTFLSVMLVLTATGSGAAPTTTAYAMGKADNATPPASRPAKAYVIAEVNVKDLEGYREYVAAAFPIIQQYGGTFLVRGGKTIAVEGPPPPDRLMVIEFESLDQAKKFEYSKEYTAIAPLRQRTSQSRLMIVEGSADAARDEP